MATDYKFKIGSNKTNKAYIMFYDVNNIDETLDISTCKEVNSSTNILLRVLDVQTKKSILVVGSFSRVGQLIITVDKDGSNEADESWEIETKQTIPDINQGLDNVLTIKNLSQDYIRIEQL